MSPSLAALRLQCTPRQTFQTGYGGRIRTYVNEFQRLAPFQLGHSVRFVDWWTWHDLNVRPRPSQSRALIPLSYRSRIGTGILGEESATRLSWHRTYPLQGLRFGLRQWRRWSDSNAHRISPGTLAGCS